MRIVRGFIGALILFFNWLFTPSSIKRSADLQTAVDQQTAKLTLYEFKACPFCVKVRRAMKRQALTIETRDAKRCEQSREQLLQGGGMVKVPCLKIEDEDGTARWMYESSVIIDYLQGRFAAE